MKSRGSCCFAWCIYGALCAYAIKPSFLLLTYTIPYTIIFFNVSDVLTYKILMSPLAVGILSFLVALLIAEGMVFLTMGTKRRFLHILGMLFIILLLPIQFSYPNSLPNLCFGGVDQLTLSHGYVAKEKIVADPNHLLIAVKQKEGGSPPFTLFNLFDIEGMSLQIVKSEYWVKAWLKPAARFRLAHIMLKRLSTDVVLITTGPMSFRGEVLNAIGDDGASFILHRSRDEDAAYEFMATILATTTRVDESGAVFRGRVLVFDSFARHCVWGEERGLHGTPTSH